MIKIYRLTHYPDHDNIIFQADQDSYDSFRKMFPLRISPTQSGFEKGYYSFLRDHPYGSYRHLFDKIDTFFHDNFSVPEIRLSCYQGKKRLSEQWQPNVWKQKIESAVFNAFESKGYNVDKGGEHEPGLYWITSPRAAFQQENVHIYRRVGCNVFVMRNRLPILICQTGSRYLLNGLPASLDEILRLNGGDSKLTKLIHEFSLNTAEDDFRLMRQFISQIPPLTACEDLTFSPEPLRPQEFNNMETCFWLHENKTYLEMAHGFHTNLTTTVIEPGAGFYMQPSDLQFLLLLPEISGASVPQIEWDHVAKEIQLFLPRALPSLKIEYSKMTYPLSGETDGFSQWLETFKDNNPDKRCLTLMVIPEEMGRQKNAEEIVAINQRSDMIQRNIRGALRGGFVSTITWDNLMLTRNIQTIVETALMKGLYRLGAIPWKLMEMPIEGQPTHRVFFIGLAGNLDKCTIGAALFDLSGQLVGYGSICPPKENRGSFLFDEELSLLLKRIAELASSQLAGEKVHFVMHLTFDLMAFKQKLQAIMDELKFSADLVSVLSPDLLLLQISNDYGTPSPGMAIVGDSINRAYLMTTLARKETRGKGSIYPNPQPLRLIKHTGPSPMKTLAAQVYWLTLANPETLRHTANLPFTIVVAQALVEHAKKQNRSISATLHDKRTLFWL